MSGKIVNDFLQRTEKDENLRASIEKSVKAGSRVTFDRILDVASKAGYKFSEEDLRAVLKEKLKNRVSAGDFDLGRFASSNAPESSCASGCLSWTITYPSGCGK
jgi:hypothetical protein